MGKILAAKGSFRIDDTIQAKVRVEGISRGTKLEVDSVQHGFVVLLDRQSGVTHDVPFMFLDRFVLVEQPNGGC